MSPCLACYRKEVVLQCDIDDTHHLTEAKDKMGVELEKVKGQYSTLEGQHSALLVKLAQHGINVWSI